MIGPAAKWALPSLHGRLTSFSTSVDAREKRPVRGLGAGLYGAATFSPYAFRIILYVSSGVNACVAEKLVTSARCRPVSSMQAAPASGRLTQVATVARPECPQVASLLDMGGRRPEQRVPRVVDPLAAVDLAVAVGVLAAQHLCDAADAATNAHAYEVSRQGGVWSSLAQLFDRGQRVGARVRGARRTLHVPLAEALLDLSAGHLRGHARTGDEEARGTK